MNLRLPGPALTASLRIILVLVPAGAAAQTSSAFTGFATASLGVPAGGDVANRRVMPGASIAVIGESRVGAEVDVSHVRGVNSARFVESRITTAMIDVISVWREATSLVRPYVVGGVGLLHSRACIDSCDSASTHSELGFDVAGGVFVLWNETIGARGDVRYFQSLQQPSGSPFDGRLNFWRTSIGLTISWPIR